MAYQARSRVAARGRWAVACRNVTAALLGVLALAAVPARSAAPALVWTDQHDGGAQFNDDGLCVLPTADGHLVTAGESADLIGGSDLCVRKLDRDDGSEIWQTRYEGYDDKDVAVSEITWDTAGQLIVAGFIRGCVG